MKILIVLSLASCLMLTACAPDDVQTPCPNFGMLCSKTPINHWKE